ncbi:MAG: hypothetical protein KDI39_18215, partial [Pseudomonadales bacterium]|nr:hypothetical protein [Pseudomonadales bacterium]
SKNTKARYSYLSKSEVCVMSGLVFGGVLIVGGAGWWLSHCMDLEASSATFIAPLVVLTGVGVCVGSAILMLI